MKGRIVKRSKENYTIILSLPRDASTGKYKQKWISAHGKRPVVERQLTDLMHRYNTTGFLDDDNVKTAEFLERWLTVYKPHVSTQSYDRSASIVHRHLIPDLGEVPLAKILPEHLQRHYAKCAAAGLKPGTVKKHHAVIHSALAAAVKWGLVYRNVADIVDSPRYKRVEMQFWEADQMNEFLDKNIDSEYYPLFYTALTTGMRRSELLGLRWQDIDLLMCQLAVRRTLKHLQGGAYVFEDVKTEKSRRTIALSPNSTAILSKLFDSRSGKLATPEAQVFCGPAGQPMRPNTVSRAWQLGCKKAGVKVIRLHDARHTHATLLLKQGVHPKVVQERLGHASIAITLDLYSHVVQGLQESAAAKFDELITNKTAKVL